MRILSLLCCGLVSILQAQNTEPAPGRVIGEVTSVEAPAGRITLKTDSGTSVSVQVGEKTTYLRVPPGERDLKKAAAIALADVSAGDRVLARGRLGQDGSVAASSVIVMSKTDLAQKQQREQSEWQGSTAGTVTAVDPQAHSITVQTRAKTVVLDTTPATDFRRYAPDSVRFADARPGSLADIRPGDQVRVLGATSPDGARIQAASIVSGSFRNIAASVLQVNAGTNELRIKDLQTQKPVIIRCTGDSMLRRLPEGMAGMLAMRLRARGTASPAPPGGHPPELHQILERMPPLALAELKPGDALILSGTNGADASKVTAIVLVAGVEPLLTAPSGTDRALSGSWNFDLSSLQQ